MIICFGQIVYIPSSVNPKRLCLQSWTTLFTKDHIKG